MLVFARVQPDAYERAMQEDSAVEWLTMFLFLGAAIASFAMHHAHRRFGDLLIALFCIAAAGEEISWGQRVLAYVPPETFLARNAQQEANLHNLVEVLGQPKWSLIAIIAAFGIMLPIAGRMPATARLLERLRTTPPGMGVAVWSVIVILIEVVYPVPFTGEWAEAMAGVLFLWGVARTPGFALPAMAACSVLALGAAAWSARTSATDVARIECARSESAAILGALAAMGYPSERNPDMHRRIGSLWIGGRVDRTVHQAVTTVSCASEGESRQARRRRYGIDPWGNSYWLRTDREASGQSRLRVYSFGANRRRDHDRIGGPVGDDVVADSASRR